MCGAGSKNMPLPQSQQSDAPQDKSSGQSGPPKTAAAPQTKQNLSETSVEGAYKDPHHGASEGLSSEAPSVQPSLQARPRQTGQQDQQAHDPQANSEFTPSSTSQVPTGSLEAVSESADQQLKQEADKASAASEAQGTTFDKGKSLKADRSQAENLSNTARDQSRSDANAESAAAQQPISHAQPKLDFAFHPTAVESVRQYVKGLVKWTVDCAESFVTGESRSRDATHEHVQNGSRQNGSGKQQ